jgi:hypothetical protein
MAFQVQCEGCSNNISVSISLSDLGLTSIAQLLPAGWGITGVPGVTPTKLLCGNCRAFVGGYTISSYLKIFNTATASGSVAAITLVSGTNTTGTYPV